MNPSRAVGLALLAALATALSACAYPISRHYRQAARRDLDISKVLPDPTSHQGALVIWGGVILAVLNGPEGSQLEVLEVPLDFMGEPTDPRYSRGRFMAQSADFLDPEVYKKGDKVTLAGEIAGKETRPLGKAQYSYPVLAIKQIHVWAPHEIVYPPPYYGWSGRWESPYYYGPYFY